LPARFDDTEIIGLEDVSYIDLTEFTAYEFAELVINKVKTTDENDLKERLREYIPKSKKFNYTLNYSEISILESFDNSRFRYRAISKIAQGLGEDREIIRKNLLYLKDKGLVDLVDRPQGQKWVITNDGKEYLDYFYHELDESSGSG